LSYERISFITLVITMRRPSQVDADYNQLFSSVNFFFKLFSKPPSNFLTIKTGINKHFI